MTDQSNDRRESIAAVVQERMRARRRSESQTAQFGRHMLQTMPMVLAGTMALAMTTQTVSANPAPENRELDTEPEAQIIPQAAAETPVEEAEASSAVAAVAVPASYTVKKGDTVSGIAARHGLSTAKVLSLNGLSWKSLIFPGQVLTLSDAKPSGSSTGGSTGSTTSVKYTIKSGDTVSGIAARYKVSTSAVLKANGLSMNSIIYPGQVLTIPGTSSSGGSSTPADGGSGSTGGSDSGTSGSVKYTIKSGDTVSGIAARYKVSTSAVLKANGLNMNSIIYPGQVLTIPGTSSSGGSSTPADGGSNGDTGAGDTGGSGSGNDDADSGDKGDTAGTGDEVILKCEQVTYTINGGDTVSKIAAKFGVTTQSVLNANGLSWSSIIYSGRTLVINNPTKLTDNCVVYAQMTAEMRRNAQVIVDVGRAAGVSDYGLVIALAAAAQESGLRNITYGDRDSVGLFQQRPSSGWGTVEQILDPVHAAKAFFGGAGNPNKGKTRGLLDISGWQSMTVTQAAQAVQRSATPEAYAKWENSARQWLSQLD